MALEVGQRVRHCPGTPAWWWSPSTRTSGCSAHVLPRTRPQAGTPPAHRSTAQVPVKSSRALLKCRSEQVRHRSRWAHHLPGAVFGSDLRLLPFALAHTTRTLRRHASPLTLVYIETRQRGEGALFQPNMTQHGHTWTRAVVSIRV